MTNKFEAHKLRPGNDSTRCHCYMIKKKRFCNQKRRNNNSRFCGNHAQLDDPIVSVIGGDNENDYSPSSSSSSPVSKKRCVVGRNKDTDHRIPCPIDSSHTIWNYALERHIKKCPKVRELKQLESLPYYIKGVNCGHEDEHKQEQEQDQEQEKNQENVHTLVEEKCDNATDGKQLSLEDARKLARTILQVYMLVFQKSTLTKASIKKLSYSDLYNVIDVNDASAAEEKAGLSNQLRLFKVKTGGTKHVLQQASFVGNLRTIEILPRIKHDDKLKASDAIHNFVEMGAGRAMLGLVVAGVANAAINKHNSIIQHKDPARDDDKERKVSLYMIERGSSKGKADTRLRSVNLESYDECHNKAAHQYIDLRGIDTERLKCDLADIKLSKALPKDKECFVVGKHVCGVATDLALRSLSSIKTICRGCAFATCCHGICNWKDYVGKKYIIDAFDKCGFPFGKGHFDQLVKWTGGSTLIEAKDGMISKSNGEEHVHHFPKDESVETGIKQIIIEADLSCGVRGLGRACQRIIDYGRCEYMRDVLGYQRSSELKHYVDESITPQNALLIGRK